MRSSCRFFFGVSQAIHEHHPIITAFNTWVCHGPGRPTRTWLNLSITFLFVFLFTGYRCALVLEHSLQNPHPHVSVRQASFTLALVVIFSYICMRALCISIIRRRGCQSSCLRSAAVYPPHILPGQRSERRAFLSIFTDDRLCIW